MKLGSILLLVLAITLTACPSNNQDQIPPQNPQEPSPTPPVNVCDPNTQPTPHWGTRDGECLQSCGALGGIANSDTQMCDQLGLIDAGKAYDVKFCCKDPKPQPSPTPKVCPGLKKWGIGIHIITNSHGQMVNYLEAGGSVLLDTTPKFGCSGVSGPCNGEHDNCGGRACEDPLGGVFSVIGPKDGNVQSNPYQYKIGDLASGDYIVTVCPRADLRDALGEKVKVCGGNACSSVSFTVP